jgi:hypothetical protein
MRPAPSFYRSDAIRPTFLESYFLIRLRPWVDPGTPPVEKS